MLQLSKTQFPAKFFGGNRTNERTEKKGKRRGQSIQKRGSGCGSVGRAVATDSRGLRFESSHQHKFILNNVYCQLIEKTKIKKKRPDIGPIFNIQKRRETQRDLMNLN